MSGSPKHHGADQPVPLERIRSVITGEHEHIRCHDLLSLDVDCCCIVPRAQIRRDSSRRADRDWARREYEIWNRVSRHHQCSFKSRCRWLASSKDGPALVGLFLENAGAMCAGKRAGLNVLVRSSPKLIRMVISPPCGYSV